MMLLSGGWFAVGVGVLLGRSGTGVIDPETMLTLTPLAVLGLGWIGLLVGIQVRREVLARMPAGAVRLSLVDCVVSSIVFGCIGALGLQMWIGEWFSSAVLGALAAIAFGSIGWGVETRSLGARDTSRDQLLSMIVRASGGLAGTLSVALFGIVTAFGTRGLASDAGVDFRTGLMRLVVSVTVALAMGMLGRLALKYTGRSSGEQLAVFLGVVAFGAGISNQFGASPLFTGMLCGIVVANLPGMSLRSFERFILRAEQVVATLTWILVGILLDVAIGVEGLLLGVMLGFGRLLIKQALFSGFLRGHPVLEHGRTLLTFSAMRQCPLALVMGLGLYLTEPSSFHAKLLCVLVVSGLIGAVGPLLSAMVIGGRLRERATVVHGVRA